LNPAGALPRVQAPAQERIDRIFETHSRFAHLLPELLYNVVVQCQSCSHIMMISCLHHDA
jgi:hypothetical protein